MTPYPKYKPSSVEWIGDIPEHWNYVSLKHIVSTKITDGPHETPKFVYEGVPFVSAEAVRNGKIDFDYIRGYISEDDDIEYSKKCKPQKDDIFIVKSGSTTGKIAYVDFDTDFNIWSPLALVRTNNKAIPKYLYHALSSKYFQLHIQLNWSFGTQPNIGMNVIENLHVLLPTPAEQTAIANYLDAKTAAIDELIATKQKLIELYEEEKTALINHAVTKGLNPNAPMKDSGIDWLGEIPEHWEVKKLKYVALLKSGDSITSDSIKDDGQYPVYGGNGIRGFYEDYTHDGQYVLIGRQGALCGNVKITEGRFWASEHAIVTTLKNKDSYKWLNYLLTTMNLNQYSQSAAQPGLAVDRIQNLSIPTIQLAEQQSIVDYIETESKKIDTQIANTTQLIELLTEYRTALISEVVTGKIKVTN